MITITGSLEAGEAQETLRAIRARYYGAGFAVITFASSILLGLAVGGGVALIINKLCGTSSLFWSTFYWPTVIISAAASSFLASRRLSVNRYRQNMQKRGMSTSFRYSFSLNDDELVMQTEWVRQIAPWASVTEIIRSGRYWIFMIGLDPWFAPSRLFSSTEEEVSFIATSLARLSQEARARSHDAIAFVGP